MSLNIQDQSNFMLSFKLIEKIQIQSFTIKKELKTKKNEIFDKMTKTALPAHSMREQQKLFFT